MKQLFFALSLMLCGTQAFSQLLDLVVEHHVLSNPAGQPEGTYTYRVYAELANSDDFLLAVYGHSSVGYCSSLEISTTTSFYNYAGIATTGIEINEVFFPIFPEVEADSWVTIGASNNTFTDGNITLLNGSGQTFESSFNVEDGVSFYSEEAYYYILTNQEVGLPIGPNNRVLLGQFTTSGALSLKLNMVVDVHGNSENRIEYVWDDTCIGSDLASGLEQVHPALTFGECNDPTAINFNAATSSNEDCIFLVGCTDALACNYMASAITDDGSCTFDCGCNDPLASNYNPDDTGTADCEYISGCMDPNSCFYDPLAVIDTGCEIEIPGCMDELAYNYNANANCADECSYEILGRVFYDLNVNGIEDAEENGISMQTVTAEPGGYSVETDLLGNFSLILPAGEYEITATTSPEYPAITTGTPINYTAGEITAELQIGMSYSDLPAEIYVEPAIPFVGIICDDYVNVVGILVVNNGNVSVNGYVEIYTDPLINEGFMEISPIDSVVGDWTYLSFGVLAPNESITLQISFFGPPSEFQGQYLDFSTLGYAFVNDVLVDVNGGTPDAYIVCDCDDSDACNYNPGSYSGACIYNFGCTDDLACNYNPDACGDDGSCNYDCGCNDPTACNYNTEDTTDVTCDYDCGCNDPLALNYNPDDTGTADCEYISGCMDPNSCLYDPLAVIDTGCDNEVLGCMDEFANNYDPNATCPFDCFYAVQGTVFYDVNANGVMDLGEEGLPWQSVNTVSPGAAAVTDDFGNFTLFLPDGDYELVVSTTEAFELVTTVNPYSFTTAGGTADIFIGLNASQTVNNLSIDTWTYPEGESIICNEFPNVMEIWIQNYGNTTLGGYVQISIDDIIGASGYVEMSPIDSIVGGFIYMSIPELGPSEFHFLEIGITGPEYLYEGQSVDLSASVYGIANDEQVCTSTYTSSGTVLCAYDPNDKQVLPKGYAEPHYIEPDTTLIYNVRFQNTGSFMAFDVLVRDTISEHLDLSTFALKAHSHCVQTFIDPITREVQFMFNNIMLPDSNCCEPDSHGMLAYSIRPLPDLVHNTLIENTAHIFFDLNPAIVTNTTWNSIFICDESFAGIDASALEICEGEELQFETSSDNIETQSWMLNGESAGDTEALNISPEPGEYEITLVATNPLCEQTGNITAVVHPTPEVSFDSNENTLTASEGSSYQWYLNGNAIDGAIEQDFMISEEGQYSVDVISEDGCSGSSEQVFVAYVGISEQWKDELVLYPMPVDHGGTLYFSGINTNKISLIRVYDSYGKLMLERVGSTNQIVIGDWAAGPYILEIAGDEGLAKVKVVVK